MDEIILNRLSKFIDDIRTLSGQAQNLCNILDNDNLETAKVVAAKLKSILSRFTSELYNYFNICKDPDSDEISNFTKYQLEGEEVFAELEARLKSKSELSARKDAEPSSYGKLPDLNMPVFSGDLLEWHQFWDQFMSNISRRKLNDVDKLLYLKGSLNGAAAKLIDGFDTTNKSYELAVNTLKARYGKEHEIIHAHHRALNKVKRAEKMEDCQSTLDDIERHLRVLQSMGENIGTNQMRYLIMEKFPTELIYETKMRLCSGTESVEDILKQLSMIISTKEEARRITLTNQDIVNETSQPQYTVETLHVNDTFQRDKEHSFKNNRTFKDTGIRKQWNDTKQKYRLTTKREFESKENGKWNSAKWKKWPCIFCGGNHFNMNCDKVKNIDERKAKLKDRCFMCFKVGHNLSTCTSKRKCQYCHKYGVHNMTLCPKAIGKAE